MTFRPSASLQLRLAALVLTFVAIFATFHEGAYSTMTSQRTASQAISSGLLQPVPGTPVAVRGTCVATVSHQIRVTWAQTPSVFADGYEIFRRTGAAGTFVSVGTVVGRTTTTFTNQFGDSGWNTNYTYRIQAKRNLWRSTNSATVTIRSSRRADCS